MRMFYFVTEYSKVIAIGGYNLDDLASAELVDVSGEGKVCPEVPDFPYKVQYLLVTFYQGKVLACGGISSGTYQDKCYSLGSDLSKWEELDSHLLSKRDKMSSSIIDNKWFISGGYDGFKSLKETMVYDGTQFSPGPEMELSHQDHCQLAINSTHIFFAGGSRKETFLLDWGSGIYFPLDDMPEYLGGACGVLNNENHGMEVLIAEFTRAFIFSFNDLSWREGPLIPQRLTNLKYVLTKNGFVSLGGIKNSFEYVGSIHEFNEILYEWIPEVAQLQIGMANFGAAAVPDDFANCV